MSIHRQLMVAVVVGVCLLLTAGHRKGLTSPTGRWTVSGGGPRQPSWWRVFLRRLNNACCLRPDSGPCEALIPRYFFNTTSKQCEQFIYGGCLGNANNFRDQQQCDYMCTSRNRQCPKGGKPLPNVFCGRGPGRQDCPTGYSCNIDPLDRFAVCCPAFPHATCQDHPCPHGHTCVKKEVVCITSPCPPVLECLPDAATVPPSPTCLERPCPKDQECVENRVVCVRAPCPPIWECRPRAQTVRSPPSCQGRPCPPGEKCVENKVTCVRAPCPPIWECRP